MGDQRPFLPQLQRQVEAVAAVVHHGAFHRTVQDLDAETAAWFHGILHMIEGDESVRDELAKAASRSELALVSAAEC